MPVTTKSWNLEDGLKLVRAIQPDTRRYGYHLTLGGGVLNNGESKKDIDLYFLPLNNDQTKPDAQALIEWLCKIWGYAEEIGDPSYGVGTGALSLDSEPLANAFYAAPAPPPTSQPPQPTLTRTSARYTGSTAAYQIDSSWRASPLAPSSSISSNRYNEVILDELEPFSPNSPQDYEPRATGPYEYMLKFNRRGDRIDAFIIRQ